MLFQRLFPSSLFSWPLITILIKEKNLSTCLDLIVSRGGRRGRESMEKGGGRGLTKVFIYFFPKLLISFMFWGTFIYVLVCLCSVLV